jgi:hypothetical protein
MTPPPPRALFCSCPSALDVSSYDFQKEQTMEALTDLKVWLLVLIMAIICVPNAAITSFTSILLKAIGYTSQEALIIVRFP